MDFSTKFRVLLLSIAIAIVSIGSTDSLEKAITTIERIQLAGETGTLEGTFPNRLSLTAISLTYHDDEGGQVQIPMTELSRVKHGLEFNNSSTQPYFDAIDENIGSLFITVSMAGPYQVVVFQGEVLGDPFHEDRFLVDPTGSTESGKHR